MADETTTPDFTGLATPVDAPVETQQEADTAAAEATAKAADAKKASDDAESERVAAQRVADGLKPVDGLAVLFALYDTLDGPQRSSVEENAAVEKLRSEQVTKDEVAIEAADKARSDAKASADAKVTTEPF